MTVHLGEQPINFDLISRCKTWNAFPLPLVAQSTHNSGPPGHDDVHGRGHWPSAEQTLDMIDLPLSSSDRPGRPHFLHENGFQMEVVIERDSQHDRLLLGRVERRWPHGTSASGR